MHDLNDKTAIVTGGGRGIGAAIGAALARAGASVLLVDQDESDLKAAVAATERESVAYEVADVSSEQDTRRYVQKAVERFGGVDILVANAGIEGTLAPIVDTDPAAFDRVLAVNLRGVWLGIKYAVPELKKRGGGSIVVMSSVAGLIGYPGMAPYCCSKHALVGLTKTAALEYAGDKIRVNSIHPGPIETPMMQSLENQVGAEDPKAARAGFEAMVPLGRYGTPKEIADLTLFLASEASAFCTGGTFVADGGFVAR